jgi:outer membrane protein OmpA-like peptidoglycan-associated protein
MSLPTLRRKSNHLRGEYKGSGSHSRLTMSKVSAEERMLHEDNALMSRLTLRTSATTQIRTIEAGKRRPKSARPLTAGEKKKKDTIHSNPPWITLPNLGGANANQHKRVVEKEHQYKRVVKKDRKLVINLDQWDPEEQKRSKKLKEYWKKQRPIAAQAAANAAMMAKRAAHDAMYGDYCRNGFQPGDRIGILANVSAGSLDFFKNGKKQGRGYTSGSVLGPVVWMIHMKYSGSNGRLIEAVMPNDKYAEPEAPPAFATKSGRIELGEEDRLATKISGDGIYSTAVSTGPFVKGKHYMEMVLGAGADVRALYVGVGQVGSSTDEDGNVLSELPSTADGLGYWKGTGSSDDTGEAWLVNVLDGSVCDGKDQLGSRQARNSRSGSSAKEPVYDGQVSALMADAVATKMVEDAAAAAIEAVRIAKQAAASTFDFLANVTKIAGEATEHIERANKSKRARKRWRKAFVMWKAVYKFGDKEVLLRRMLQNVQDAMNRQLGKTAPDVEVMLVPDKAIILKKPINFEPGTAEVLLESKPILKQVATVIKVLSDIVVSFNYDMIHLRVEGHVNPTADAANGMLVSDKRASAVVGHCCWLGTPREMLHPKGFGGTVPKGDPVKNRRVEVHVMSDQDLAEEEREIRVRRASYIKH